MADLGRRLCSGLDARGRVGLGGGRLRQALEVVEELLLDDDGQVREEARMALSNLLNAAHPEQRGLLWQRVAGHAQPRARCAALRVLDTLTLGEDLAPSLLLAAAQDAAMSVRQEALRQLRGNCWAATRAAGLAAAHDPSALIRALAPGTLSFWLYEDGVQATLRQLADDPEPQVRLALARRLAEESALPHVGSALHFLDAHFDPRSRDPQLRRDLDRARGRALAHAAHHGSEADRARVARWIPHLTTLAASDVQFMAQVPPGRRLLAALCQAPCPEVRGIAQQVAAGPGGARRG